MHNSKFSICSSAAGGMKPRLATAITLIATIVCTAFLTRSGVLFMQEDSCLDRGGSNERGVCEVLVRGSKAEVEFLCAQAGLQPGPESQPASAPPS